MEDIRIITDNIVLLIVLLVVTEVFLISRLIRSNKSKKEFTAMKKVAYDIHKQTQVLKKTIDEICLGEKKCGKCIGKHCLIGYIRFILDDARENFNYYDNYHINLDFLAKKNYDSKEVVKALSIILLDYDKYGWNSDQNFIVNKIRYGLEYILIGRTLSEVSGLKNYINIFMKINKSLGYDLGKEIISNRNKDDSYFLVEDG